MGTPHKHAALIKAWADGAEIQVHVGDNEWRDLPHNPNWGGLIYRIKPKTIKYRNFLWTPTYSPACPVVCVCSEKDNQSDPRETWQGFIRWLGDWQEVEV